METKETEYEKDKRKIRGITGRKHRLSLLVMGHEIPCVRIFPDIDAGSYRYSF